jgi:nicotinamidase-related amidase
MPITTIDPCTALIVVDLQKGIVALPVATPIDGIIARAAELADAFRRVGLPVVLVRVNGRAPGRTERSRVPGALPPDFAEFVPALSPRTGDHTIAKQTAGAFTRTGLEDLLRSKGVTQIVIAGVSTSMGVESTGRHAHELGFHVTFAVDAMTDLDADLHANSVAKVFPRIGETGTTADILAILAQRAA